MKRLITAAMCSAHYVLTTSSVCDRNDANQEYMTEAATELNRFLIVAYTLSTPFIFKSILIHFTCDHHQCELVHVEKKKSIQTIYIHAQSNTLHYNHPLYRISNLFMCTRMWICILKMHFDLKSTPMNRSMDK